MVIAAAVAQHQTQLQNIQQVWDWAKRIFNAVKDLMNLKKQTKGQPCRIEVSGDNDVVNLITAENVLIPITRESSKHGHLQLSRTEPNSVAEW